jgi:hypothetical protein
VGWFARKAAMLSSACYGNKPKLLLNLVLISTTPVGLSQLTGHHISMCHIMKFSDLLPAKKKEEIFRSSDVHLNNTQQLTRFHSPADFDRRFFECD